MNKSRMKAMIIVIILAIVLTGVIVGSRTLLPQEDKTVAIVLKSEPSSEFWKEVFAGSQKRG